MACSGCSNKTSMTTRSYKRGGMAKVHTAPSYSSGTRTTKHSGTVQITHASNGHRRRGH